MPVDLLSYPSDEADTAKAAIDELVELVGSWITKPPYVAGIGRVGLHGPLHRQRTDYTYSSPM